jgi:hypothetical protein
MEADMSATTRAVRATSSRQDACRGLLVGLKEGCHPLLEGRFPGKGGGALPELAS